MFDETPTEAQFNTHIRDNLNALRETAYTEAPGVNITATSEGSATTIVTASAVTFNGTATTVVEFFCPNLFVAANGAGNACTLVLYQDGASIGLMGELATNGNVVLESPVYMFRKLTPASGSRTYSIRAYRTNADCIASSGVGGSGQWVPGFIRLRA